MHPLLKRQLKRQFGSPEAVPESLQEFFERINVDYEKGDADHALALHSLGEMSRELNERNETLRRERDEQVALAKSLEEAHNQLLQSEKMASIGQLAAGVAHEINNPVGYVNSNLKSLDTFTQDLLTLVDAYERSAEHLPTDAQESLSTLREQLDIDFLKTDVVALLRESQEGIDRVKKIVQDLKDFSHVDDGNFNWADLHLGLNSTLNIVNNEIKYKADVFKEYGDIPMVECLPSQLNQVFMNLLVNAAHAMPVDVRGKITVRTGMNAEDMVCVEVSDNGSGIPKENLTRIFDPFFTTKPVGKGTGLGLSLAYGIVKKHGGCIEVSSTVGVGTTFRILLPVRQQTSAQ